LKTGGNQLSDGAADRISYGAFNGINLKGKPHKINGEPIEIAIVAAVRPLRSNHVSEYFGARTRKTGCAIALNSWPKMTKA
jgi:hypothetical protein